eukprot:sb/3479158/
MYLYYNFILSPFRPSICSPYNKVCNRPQNARCTINENVKLQNKNMQLQTQTCFLQKTKASLNCLKIYPLYSPSNQKNPMMKNSSIKLTQHAPDSE